MQLTWGIQKLGCVSVTLGGVNGVGGSVGWWVSRWVGGFYVWLNPAT